MRLSRQFQARLFIFFFYKKVLNAQKAPKCKTSDFHPFRSLCAPKIVTFVVFCSLIFAGKVSLAIQKRI